MESRIWIALAVIAALTVACAPAASTIDAGAQNAPTTDVPADASAAPVPPAQVPAQDTVPAKETQTEPLPSAETTAGAQAIQEIRIEAFDWGFEPSRITVPVGTRVRLIATSREGEHGISIPEFDVTTGTFGPGETKTVEFIPDKTGTFSFRCNVYCGEGHREMTGTIVVT